MRLNTLWKSQREFMSINIQIKEQVNMSETGGITSRTETVHTFLTIMLAPYKFHTLCFKWSSVLNFLIANRFSTNFR